jgi:hypothetical protein
MSLRGRAPEERNPFEAEVASARPSRAGSGIVFMSVLVALVWGGASSAAFVAPDMLASLVGMDTETFLRMVSGAAMIGLPSIAMVTAGLVARAGIRAREDAGRLADAANSFLNPSPHAEAEARRLGVAVRGEIAALDRALEVTLSRVGQLENTISGQTHGMDGAVAAAVAAAQDLGERLERERIQLNQLADKIDAQSRDLTEIATHHVRMMSDAARQAEAETRAVADQLDQRLQSFGASAALLGQRAQELEMAARRSAETTLTLDDSIGRALDALANASHLADASRHSADESAAIAARAADDLRRVTSDSLVEARRTAEALRNETSTASRDAHEGIARLEQAAEAARQASQAFNIASHASAEEAARRINKMGETLQTASQRAEQTIESRINAIQGYVERAAGTASNAADRLSARADALQPPAPRIENAPPQRPLDAPARSFTPPPPPPQAAPRPAAANAGGSQRREFGWSWNDVLSSADGSGEKQDGNGQEFRRSVEPPRNSPVSMESLTQSPVTPTSLARDPEAILRRAGLRVDEVFTHDTLDQIQRVSRGGEGARRRSVTRAAQEAVRVIQAQFDRDPDARAAARHFQLGTDGEEIATLLDKGKAKMMAPEVRCFLLIDAALA